MWPKARNITVFRYQSGFGCHGSPDGNPSRRVAMATQSHYLFDVIWVTYAPHILTNKQTQK